MTTSPDVDDIVERLQRIYKPSKTAIDFMASDARVRILKGGVGTGKTSVCVQELMRRALEMPVCIDGVRRFRGMLVRNTYRELENTTIPTWQFWFDSEYFGRMRESSPARHKMEFTGADGVKNKFDFKFMALDRPEDFEKARGSEATMWYFNELSEIDELNFRDLIQRIGRYPGVQMLRPGTEYFRGIIADTNPPPERSWLYNAFEIKTPELWEVFSYPGGLKRDGIGGYVPNPLAENIENLPGGYEYYFDMVKNAKNDESIKVAVLNEYGSNFSGRPCFKEYNPIIHRAPGSRLFLSPDHEIAFGWDYGLDPCCTIEQFYLGKLTTFHELIGHGMALEQFLEEMFFPFLTSSPFYEHFKKGNYVSLPDCVGGMQRNQVSGSYPVQVLNQNGIKTDEPSKEDRANYVNIKKRLDSVRYFLTRLVGGNPAYQLAEHCIELHEGFKGGYKYKQRTINTFKQDMEEPEKNKYSHIQDAHQAVCLHYVAKIATVSTENMFKPQFLSPNWMEN